MNDAVGEALQSVMQVDDYLDQLSYKVDPDYVPSDFALVFVTFIKLVNGQEGEEHKSPLTHYFMLDTLFYGEDKIINLCHRGMAKTTVMGEYLFLFIGVHGDRDWET